MEKIKPIIALLVLTAIAFQVPNASAVCKACQGTEEDWTNSAAAFLEGTPLKTEPTLITAKSTRAGYEALKSGDSSDATKDAAVTNPDAAKNSSDIDVKDNSDSAAGDSSKTLLQRSESFGQRLVPVSADLDADVVVDISPNATEYIPGAISINYEDFLGTDKRLKSVAEISRMLGDAGISQADSVIIYGECQPCGGGPSAATYVYWIMKYLGHENVRMLDGGIDDWVMAKRPTETSPSVIPQKSYTATIKPELLATYEYVKSGNAQIVDARSLDEFGVESIPGAVNIPYEDVLDEKRIKDEADLKKLFSGLSKDKPVVVYTETGVKATMVWFALDLLGFDSRVYSWQDWVANQPRLNISLKEAKANPNPANIGSVVTITAIFQEQTGQEQVKQEAAGQEQVEQVQEQTEDEQTEQLPVAEEIEEATSNAAGAASFAGVTDAANTTGATDAVNATDIADIANETILTIKGCATCGFGSPQGFADISSDSGFVQIGSKGSAKASASNSGFKCTARITSPSGAEVDKVIMKRVSGDEFAGIWNANVAAGTYDVTITASAGDITKTFPYALEIEVAGSSKYKNLG